MILKRKKISRKYAMALTRIKADSSKWCSYCDYFNNFDNEGRKKCTWIINHKDSISIRETCLNVLPIKIGGELKNYVYIVIEKKRG